LIAVTACGDAAGVSNSPAVTNSRERRENSGEKTLLTCGSRLAVGRERGGEYRFGEKVSWATGRFLFWAEGGPRGPFIFLFLLFSFSFSVSLFL
jgi:hypothetical protein